MTRKEYIRNWIKNHPKRMKEIRKKAAKKFRKNHPNYRNDWNKKNKGKVKESKRRWELDNPEKVKEGRRRYRLKHKEKIREYKRKYRLLHGRKPLKLRFQIFQRDNFTCKYCGRNPKEDGVKLEIDHIHPKSKGGLNKLENYITACSDCNRGKGDALLKIIN